MLGMLTERPLQKRNNCLRTCQCHGNNALIVHLCLFSAPDKGCSSAFWAASKSMQRLTSGHPMRKISSCWCFAVLICFGSWGCCRPALQQPSLPAQTRGPTVLHNKLRVCRDVKRQGQEIRHMQSLQRHGKQAIAAAPMLQERHRDFMRKLIRAKAELQILQLDGKQVENRSICCIAPHYPASTYHYAQHIHKELRIKTWCNHTLKSLCNESWL